MTEPTPKIRMLTYNFFMRPPPLTNHGDDYKDERMEAFKAFLPNYDIICFQEVFNWMNSRPQKLIKIAEEFGFKFHSLSPNPVQSFLLFWPWSNSGCLTISRYPITDFDFYAFEHSVSADKMAWKGKKKTPKTHL
jgi:hypothetical protein